MAWQARAVRARPHDTALTVRLEVYRLGLARLRAQQGHFDEARTLLTAHLEKATPANRSLILCRLAAVELKAGQTQRGEAWFGGPASAVPVVLGRVVRARSRKTLLSNRDAITFRPR